MCAFVWLRSECDAQIHWSIIFHFNIIRFNQRARTAATAAATQVIQTWIGLCLSSFCFWFFSPCVSIVVIRGRFLFSCMLLICSWFLRHSLCAQQDWNHTQFINEFNLNRIFASLKRLVFLVDFCHIYFYFLLSFLVFQKNDISEEWRRRSFFFVLYFSSCAHGLWVAGPQCSVIPIFKSTNEMRAQGLWFFVLPLVMGDKLSSNRSFSDLCSRIRIYGGMAPIRLINVR